MPKSEAARSLALAVLDAVAEGVAQRDFAAELGREQAVCAQQGEQLAGHRRGEVGDAGRPPSRPICNACPAGRAARRRGPARRRPRRAAGLPRRASRRRGRSPVSRCRGRSRCASSIQSRPAASSAMPGGRGDIGRRPPADIRADHPREQHRQIAEAAADRRRLGREVLDRGDAPAVTLGLARPRRRRSGTRAGWSCPSRRRGSGCRSSPPGRVERDQDQDDADAADVERACVVRKCTPSIVDPVGIAAAAAPAARRPSRGTG